MHLQALLNAKEIAEAAGQCSRQARQTRQALRKALQEEAAEKERENKRMEKEAAARAKKEEAAKKKEQKKQEKKAEQEAAKAKRKAEEEEGGGEKRRRGKGADEILESDPPVLFNRFYEHEIPIVDSLDELVELVISGSPGVWRARRAPLKKVLEASDPNADAKTINSAVLLLRGEHKTYLGTVSEKVAAGTLERSPQFSSEQSQVHLQALAFDNIIAQYLESEVADQPDQTKLTPAVVMDRDSIAAESAALRNTMTFMEPRDALKADAETGLYNNLHHLGIKRGFKFAGVMQGLWGHFCYQMEGSRMISMAALCDVTWFVVGSCEGTEDTNIMLNLNLYRTYLVLHMCMCVCVCAQCVCVSAQYWPRFFQICLHRHLLQIYGGHWWKAFRSLRT